MQTRKLYYEDAFLRTFEATVLSCEAGKKGYDVVLSATAFYPEGGGQPCDLGTLGGAAVTDVREKDGIITHTCDKPLPVGESVCGKLDWQRRFDHMQQHSGEHIVSGMLCSAYHCDNVGFHLGADKVVIDYNADIPWEGVLAVEAQANRYLWENHPFCETWYEGAALEAVEYRSKKPLEGAVRITEFPDADRCACCGTHVALSGQVGLVKFIGHQKFRDGVRLELLCGMRALEYLALNQQQNQAVAQALSVKVGQTHTAVQRLQNELVSLKQRNGKLEEQSFAAIAANYDGCGDTVLFHEKLDGDAARRLCDMVATRCGGRCAVFAGEEGAYTYAVIHAGQDIRDFIKQMNTALNGRGGGRDGFAQGSVACTAAEINAFFGGEA